MVVVFSVLTLVLFNFHLFHDRTKIFFKEIQFRKLFNGEQIFPLSKFLLLLHFIQFNNIYEMVSRHC